MNFNFSKLMVCAIAIVTAGCSNFNTIDLNPFDKTYVLACPNNLILGDAQKATFFKPGGGKDLVDVTQEAKLEVIELTCATDLNNQTLIGTMDVEVLLTFDVKKGPANSSGTVTFPYFISVTDLEREILYREKFNLEVSFESGIYQLKAQNKPLILQLPLTPEIVGTNYRIYGGIELTKEQLNYNRGL